MKKECAGLLGRIFGHCFKSYLIKAGYQQPSYVSYNIEGADNVFSFIESQRNIYTVRCKRCGEEKATDVKQLYKEEKFS